MKKNIFIALLYILLLFISGCSLNNTKGKPERELFFDCKIQDNYSVNDEIVLTIYFGTRIVNELTKKNNQDYYKAQISVINKKNLSPNETESDFICNPENYPDRIIIADFDDFCLENYPLIINRQYNFTSCSYHITYEAPSSINYTLPKSLLVDDSGIIIIVIKSLGTSGVVRLKYLVDDNNYSFYVL